MILFETGIKAEGCLAELAAVLCLVPATSSSVAADLTIWMTVVRDQLRESLLFETKGEARVLCSMANFS